MLCPIMCRKVFGLHAADTLYTILDAEQWQIQLDLSSHDVGGKHTSAPLGRGLHRF